MNSEGDLSGQRHRWNCSWVYFYSCVLCDLDLETIPIIWTGALIGGIVFIIRGVYNSLKGEKHIAIVQPLPTSATSHRASIAPRPNCGRQLSAEFSFYPSCGYVLQCKCSNCGSILDAKFSYCPKCGKPATENQ